MLHYWLNCRLSAETKNRKMEKANTGKLIFFIELLSVWFWKTEIYIEQKAIRLLGNLGIKATLDKFPILGPI